MNPVPSTVTAHLATHGLGVPPTSDDAVDRLIEEEDKGCETCSGLLNRYIDLHAEARMVAEKSESGGTAALFRTKASRGSDH